MNIFIVAAMTADGYIGKDASHLSTDWTNKADKELFTRYIKQANNMVMGRSTFLTTAQKYPTVFTKSMPGRRLFVFTHHPEDITDYPEVEATAETPQAFIERLEKEGVEDLAICGGTQIYSMFMEAGLVNDLYIDMQATLFGTGQPLFNVPIETTISLQNVERLDDSNVLLHYRVKED